MNYIRYKIQTYGLYKIFIILILLLCFACLIVSSLDPMKLTFNDLILIIFDNGIFMLSFFTILPITFLYDVGSLNRYSMHVIMKIGSIRKWYLYEMRYLFFKSALYVLLYFVIILIVATSQGFNVSNDWTSSFFYSNNVINPDSFDQSGNPFVLLITYNVSPNLSLTLSLLFLFFRIVFYGALIFAANILSGKHWVGVSLAIVLSWFEIYIYRIVGIMTPLYILPFEHTIVTCINGHRSKLYISFIYWFLLIGFLLFWSFLNCNKGIEKYTQNQKSNNRLGGS